MAKHPCFLAGLVVVAALLPGGVGSAWAARMSYGEIEVILEFEPRGQPSHGYSEYRFQIQNRGARTRNVAIVIPANNFAAGGNSTGLRSLSKSADVPAGAISILSLLQPAVPDLAGNYARVFIDGLRQDDAFPLNPVQSNVQAGHVHPRRAAFRVWGPRSTNPDTLVLMSMRVNEQFFKIEGFRGGMMPGAMMGAGMGGMGAGPMAPPVLVEPGPGGPPPGAVGGPMVGPAPGAPGAGPVPVYDAFDGQYLRAGAGVSSWSTNWLAYSRYDLLVLLREDVEELERGSPETRAILTALWQYVEAGGGLLIVGPGQVKLPGGWSKTVQKIQGLDVYRPGFGVCMVAPDRNSSKWSSDRWQVVASTASGTGMPWKSTRSLLDLNMNFSVVDDLGIPVRGLFALIILFGIAIGPVNLVVLSRKNKRIWLLWTVPVLSGIFCLGILVYMLIAEGWQGQTRVAGFTFLDENERRATTLGKAAFYSPMTPGDGLTFSDQTEVMIQGTEHPAYTTFSTLNWAEGKQHLARGWVVARVPSHFTLRRSESRRERLNLRRDGKGIEVINALGADVRTLTLVDEKGQVYTAGPIPAGGSATLSAQNKGRRNALPLENWRRIYNGSDWALAIANAVKKPEDLLGPGTYLAVLEETPFLEQALKGARVRPSESVVLGLMAPPVAE